MHKKMNILLVEDNPGDADLLRIILEGVEEPKYQVTDVQRLSQAFQALKAERFDLAILDLGLPDSSGIETLESLIKGAPSLPIVVLTGNLEEELGLAAVKAGAQDFLHKGLISSQLLHRVLRYAFERKQAEINLRNTEQQVRTILDALDVQILLMDTNHRIKWANRKTCEDFHQSREEIIGKFCYQFWPEQTGFCETCAVEQAKISKNNQFEYRKAKIGKIWDIKACPVMDEHGEVSSIVELRNDITERVQLEEQFFQAQKMEAVGRLAGGVAHDFNNMLSVILGYTEMAKNKIPKGDEIAEYIDEIFQAGKRSTELVRQLLAFSRKQTAEPQLLDCNVILGNSQKMLKRLVGEDIELRFTPTPGLWKVMIDPTQLDQVLVNLTVNSRDAILGTGSLSISTANVTLDEEYCRIHAYANPGEYVLLEVSDSGCGMSKEILDRIFEPFFTTKKRGQGTGLGMSTIYGIVKQNNGIINVYSEVGHGTIVKIYFHREVKDNKSVPVLKNLASIDGHETLLIVEDDPAILRICRAMLTDFGYTVLVETDPLAALKLAAENSGNIDLLLTDTIMPHMNGTELKQAVEQHHPNIKTLFMSGYSSEIITRQGVLAEGVHFIQKPFSKEQLARKVRAVLDR